MLLISHGTGIKIEVMGTVIETAVADLAQSTMSSWWTTRTRRAFIEEIRSPHNCSQLISIEPDATIWHCLGFVPEKETSSNNSG